MGYVRKILLFVISVAMVVVGLLMIAFGLFWHGARVGLFVAGGRWWHSSDCIYCGRISLRR
jgi:sulfite exporter TauE/SafE